MKKFGISLGLGIAVAAMVIGFAMYVSNDLRWILVLGSAGIFVSVLIASRIVGSDAPPLLMVCLPLSVIFSMLVLHARNKALTPFDVAVCVLLWLVWGILGWLWSARSRTTAVLGTVVMLAFSGWYAAIQLPAAAVRAHDRVQSTPAPKFVLQTPVGSDIPESEWKGKIVVLDFFSETCGPCIAEIPHLEEVRRDLEHRKDIAMVVVGSNVSGDTPDSVLAYMKKNNISLQIAFDKDGAAHDAFGFLGIPALVVMDKSGNIRFSRQGYNRAEGGLFRSNLVNLLSSL